MGSNWPALGAILTAVQSNGTSYPTAVSEPLASVGQASPADVSEILCWVQCSDTALRTKSCTCEQRDAKQPQLGHRLGLQETFSLGSRAVVLGAAWLRLRPRTVQPASYRELGGALRPPPARLMASSGDTSFDLFSLFDPPTPRTIVRGVGAAGSRSRRDDTEISLCTPPAQPNPTTRAAGGIDPRGARRARTFLRCRGAIHQPCGKGGMKPPLPPINASCWVGSPTPRRGRRSPPALTRTENLLEMHPRYPINLPGGDMKPPARPFKQARRFILPHAEADCQVDLPIPSAGLPVPTPRTTTQVPSATDSSPNPDEDFHPTERTRTPGGVKPSGSFEAGRPSV